MRINFHLIILLISLSAGHAHLKAQEMAGLSSDPDSGIYGIFFNPAFSTQYSMEWQVNILTFHQFVETDYAFVTNTHLFDILGNIGDIQKVTTRNRITENNPSRQLIFDLDGGKKSFSVSTSVAWPSFLWKKNERERLGVFMRTRGLATAFRIPEQLGYYEISEVLDSTVKISPFHVSASSWTDIGFHYARKLSSDGYETSSVGINARLVLPHESGVFSLENNVDYSRFGDIFSAAGLVTKSGYNFFTSGNTGYSPRFNGIGIAADIGYHIKTNDYSYGISLLDAGFALVARKAESFEIVSDTIVTFDGSVITDPDDIIGIAEEVDRQLEPQVSRTVDEGASFVVGMPLALSLQYGRPIGSSIAVYLNLVQRLPFSKSTLRRPNSISMVPTFRSGLFALSIPTSVYEYSDFRIGLSLRYWFFHIGTDHITSLVKKGNFSGTDIYFGFQWYPFNKLRKNGDIHCFTF